MARSPLPPAITETHISVVAFIGDRAYKILKPVTTPFLDYGTTEARLQEVDAELALNRRLSPDVYLGTADVHEHGRLVDRMLVMRRLPADRRLSQLVGRPGWEEPVRQVARLVAGFHASLEPLTDPELVAGIAGRDAVRRNWDDNLAAMEPFVGSVLDPAEVAAVAALMARYLDHRERLFDERIARGQVRDGHGDLTADDIFCLDDGPRVLDCLAFDRRLRISDVLADIAFLAMDTERLGGPAVSQALMAWYGEYSAEHHPSSLAHHYVAYRAHVRAKVACLAHQQGQTGAAELARTYHRLCHRHLDLSALRLVLVGGGPGTGKTTLANRLSEALRWLSLGSDELRKDLTGHAHHERLGDQLNAGIYAPEVTEATYRELLARAGQLLARGESVVLDATWSRADLRQAAAEVAHQAGAVLVELECTAPPELARERIRRRLSSEADASDATPELVEPALASRHPWPSAHPVDTSRHPDDQLAGALAHIQRLSAAHHHPAAGGSGAGGSGAGEGEAEAGGSGAGEAGERG